MTLKPKLILGETGKVCMQLTLGQYSATSELPDELATHTMGELQGFFDRIVPGMTKELQAMQQRDNRKRRKRACAKPRRPKPDPKSSPVQLLDETPSQLPAR